MNEKKFKSLQELLDFVLKECGEMEWNIHHNNNQLRITKGFNLERIYYALYLSEKLKGIKIPRLDIWQLNLIDIDLEGGWFEKMNTLKVLNCYDNQLTRLPKLPPHLELLDCHNNNITYLTKEILTIKNVSCYDNPIYKELLKQKYFIKKYDN